MSNEKEKENEVNNPAILTSATQLSVILPVNFKELTKEEEIAMVQGLHVKKDLWDREFDWTYLDYARVLKLRLQTCGYKVKMMLCKMRSVSMIYFYIETQEGPKHYAARSVSSLSDGASADLEKTLRISPVKRDLSGGVKKPYPRLTLESELWFLVGSEIGDQVKVSVYKNSGNVGDWQIVIVPDEGLT